MNTSNEKLSAPRSRRSLLKGAAVGAAGVAGVAGLSAYALGLQQRQMVHAAAASGSSKCVDSVLTILTVAATAERLAVTFYTEGVKHASQLGLSGAALVAIKAARIEEQIHELFFVAQGGKPTIDTFSFPHGDDTFENLQLFIATQQQLEGVFDSAFLAAVKEFAQLNLPQFAQIAAQIACIESEHRALGRYIAGLEPADNWAFAPVLVPSVGAAPAIVAKAGYLSPTAGNHYVYQEVPTVGFGIDYKAPFAVPCS